MLLAAVVLPVTGTVLRPYDLLAAVLSVSASLLFVLLSVGFAYAWRKRVSEFTAPALGAPVLLAALVIYLVVFLM